VSSNSRSYWEWKQQLHVAAIQAHVRGFSNGDEAVQQDATQPGGNMRGEETASALTIWAPYMCA